MQHQVARYLAGRPRAPLLRRIISIHAVLIIFGGVFPDDPMVLGSGLTVAGAVHNVVMIGGCLAFALGILVFPLVVRSDPVWQGHQALSVVALSLALALFVLSHLPALSEVQGWLQRGYAVPSFVWIEAVSLRLLANASGSSSRGHP
jgi:hypothetical protein